jgi:hypothetical protein
LLNCRQLQYARGGIGPFSVRALDKPDDLAIL